MDTAPCSGVLGLRWGYIGPHGRAVVGQQGCISRHRERFCRHCAVFGCSWLPLGLHGGTWAGRGEPRVGTRFVDTAPCSGVLGLRWGCMGPHGRAVVGQEGCISRHRARFGGKFAVC